MTYLDSRINAAKLFHYLDYFTVNTFSFKYSILILTEIVYISWSACLLRKAINISITGMTRFTDKCKTELSGISLDICLDI